MVSHAYEDTVTLVLESLIAAGWDVTLLTNFAADTFEEAKVKFPVPRPAARRHGVRPRPSGEAGSRNLPPPHRGVRP